MGTIYDRRKETIGNIMITMIRCDEDMHICSPSTGEVAIFVDGEYTDELWTGHAAEAGDRFRYFCDLAKNGASVDEIIDMSVPAEFR